MTEDEFQQSIITLATILGWAVYHTRNSKGSEPGFPDLVMLRRHGERAEVVVAELKSDRKGAAPTHDQIWWLDTFAAAEIQTYLWRPEHWNDITARLRAPFGECEAGRVTPGSLPSPLAAASRRGERGGSAGRAVGGARGDGGAPRGRAGRA